MAAKTVRVQRDGRVLFVTLDNPPRNLMTGEMVRELDQLTREIESDRSIGAVAIASAAEGIFIWHYDISELLAGGESAPEVPAAAVSGTVRAVEALARVPRAAEALARSPAAGVVELRRFHDVFLRMNRMDKVFVAAINGMATGAGCELALACDIRLMAEGDFRIGLPEMAVGIIPGAGGTQRLARILGPARAIELILEARPVPPEEAVRLGLVHRVVPPERLLDEARATAERLARRSPTAVRAVKRAVYDGASRSLGQGLQLERTGFVAAVSSTAAVRALGAYEQQLEDLPPGALPGSELEELLGPWREGTALDMTAG